MGLALTHRHLNHPRSGYLLCLINSRPIQSIKKAIDQYSLIKPQ